MILQQPSHQRSGRQFFGALILLALMSVVLAACSGGGGGGGGGAALSRRSIDPSIVPDDAIEVTQVQYVGDKLQVTGRNLDRVTGVKLRGKTGEGEKEFNVGSKSFSFMEIWQNSVPLLGIVNDKIFELVISTAHGQAIFPLTFILQDNAVTTVKILDGAVTNPKLASGAVTLDKIADVGAADGDVIKWDAASGQWIVAPDDAGVTSGGTVTSVTRGSGIQGAGTSITGTGTIAVDTGSGPNKILQFDGSGDIEMDGIVEINSIAPNGGVLSFVDNTREFRMFNDGSLRIHDLTDGLDRFIIDSTGNISVAKDLLVTGSVTLSGNNYPTVTGSAGQVLTTNGGGVLSWSTISAGDITSVTAGTGLTGGGSSGDVSLAVDVGTGNGKIVQVGAGDKIAVSVIPTAIPAANIAGGTVDNTEFGYLDGVTSGIQAQFDALVDVPAPGADSNFMVSNGTAWVTEAGATARASLGVTIGTQVQGWDDDLDDISGLTPGNNYFLVGDGTNWTTESPTSARTSLGLGTMSTQNDSTVAITGGTAELSTITALNQGQVQLREQVGNGTQYVGLQAPGSITTSYTLTFPTGTGAAGQVMSTDGTGALVWSTDGGGDITGVTAGTGLLGGGTSGTVTLNVDVGTGNGQIVQVGAGDKIAVSVIPTAIPAANIAGGGVDNTEFSYLDGVTSSIQTQLGTKVNKAGDTMSGLLLLQTSLKIEDPGAGSKAATIVSPTLVNDYTLTLPTGTGAAGQVMSTDGTGALVWATDGGGDITGVTAGAGLTGGGTSGDVSVAHADTSAVADVANGNGTVVEDITFDTYGHVQTVTSYNLDGRYYTETESDSNFINASGDTMTGHLNINNQNQLRLMESTASGSNYVALRAAATLGSDLIFTLPSGYGSNGNILTSDGAGGMTWSSAGAGDITGVSAGTGMGGGGLSGDVTLSIVDGGVTTTQIADSTITDTDVSASAAVSWSKMADLTNDSALYSNASGDVTALSTVSSTELGYLNGVTSAIQTQLDSKVNDTGDTITGDLILSGASTDISVGGNATISGTLGVSGTTTLATSYHNAIWMQNQGTIYLSESNLNGLDAVALKGPTSLGAGYQLYMPNSAPVAGQVMLSDASGVFSWVSSMPPNGNAGGDLTGTYPNPSIAAGVIVDADVNALAGINATKLGGGTVDNTEFGYLNGVTSSIQTQFDSKVNKAGDTMSGYLRVPAIYDNDNTSYYLNPASSSQINALNLDGDITMAKSSPYIYLNDTSGSNFSLIWFQSNSVNKWYLGNTSSNDFGLYNYTASNYAYTIDDATNAITFNGTVYGTFSGDGSSLTSLNASNISSGTLANARTTGVSTNTANTLVLRDASGNFSAGTITASLTGAASLNVLKTGDTMTGNLVAPIMYDYNNNAYYVDPNGTSLMTYLKLENTWNSATTAGSFRIGATNTYNLGIDGQMVQAYNNGSAAMTYLGYYGGGVTIGNASYATNIQGDISLSAKHAFRGNDSWLRLNQDGAFTSGTHSPYNMNVSGMTVGGLYYDPGAGNLAVAGTVYMGRSVATASFSISTSTTCHSHGNLTCYYGSGSVSCPGGTTAIGGGVYGTWPDWGSVGWSYPSGATWQCSASRLSSSSGTCYVICARMGN